MLNCVYCETPLPERAIFCSSCARQTKCKSCKDLLEPNAKACVVCGTVVGEGDVSVSAMPDASNQQALNTLELKETKTSRDLKVAFRTDAIEVIKPALNHILIERLGNQITEKRNANGLPLQIKGDTSSDGKDYIDAEATEVADDGAKSLSPAAKTDKEKLHEVFYYDGDVLKLDNYELKAEGQLDAAKRLVYLFLYAHELEGRKTVARDAINAVLKDANLFDANASNWISTTLDLANEGDENAQIFRLRGNGRSAARNALADVFDSNKPNGLDLNKLATRKKTKSARADSDGGDGQTQSNKKSKEIDAWVTKWTNLKLEIDAYSAVGSASAEDKGIIALWAIRKATADEVKVVNGNKIVSFISKAFHKSPDRANLVRALEDKAKGKVRRVTDGYELTDEGIKHAEEILKFKAAPSVSSAKAE